MTRAEALARFGTDGERRLLVSRLFDCASRAEKQYMLASTAFLSPAERALAETVCAAAGLDVCFDGGFAGAERAAAVFRPEYCEEPSPVIVLRAKNTSGRELSHRDYLGALMALGVKREAVGDIVVSGDEAFIAVLAELESYISGNLEKAGAARLELSRADPASVPKPEESGEERRETVASLRLDAVLAAALRISREEAKSLCETGAVMIDHVPCERAEHPLSEGELLSVRGYGRVRLLTVCGETKKGRTAVIIRLVK